MEIAFKTDEGCVRELNEDTVQAGLLGGEFANPWLFEAYIVVADGMGGHDGGEVASRLAVDRVLEIFAAEQSPRHSLEEVSGQDLLQRLKSAVQEINHAVYRHGRGEGTDRAGTTLTLCLVRPHEYSVAHVGDSRAYLVRADSIEQITADDSWVAEAVSRGLMTEEEARHSEFRNRITKAIGLQSDIEPSVYYGQWQAGDVLLVCSDGLSEYIPAVELQELVHRRSSLEQLCCECIRLSRERGGHDNISIAAVAQPAASALGASPATTGARKPITWPPAGGAGGEGSPQEKPAASLTGRGRNIRLLAIVLVLLAGLLLAGLWGWRRATAKDKPGPQASSQEFRLHALPPLDASGQVQERRTEKRRPATGQRASKAHKRREPALLETKPDTRNRSRRRDERRRGERPGREIGFSKPAESRERLPAPASMRPSGKGKIPLPAKTPQKPGQVKPALENPPKVGGDKKSGEAIAGAASAGTGGDKSSSGSAAVSVPVAQEEQEKPKGGGVASSTAAESAAPSKSTPEKPAQ